MPTLKERTLEVYKVLKRRYPDAHCELNYTNPLELLIATILSAQCTDKRVNEVTKTLFKRCKKLDDFRKLPQEKLEEIIRSAGFFRAKAKSIKGAVEKIALEFGGEVPRELDKLVTLPGVGRKTANVILGNAFHIPGLPVDTHVKRVSKRLGLTKHEDPVKVEADLCAVLSPKDWCMFSHVLIFHGRQTCLARKPQCEVCPVRDLCPYYKSLLTGLAQGAR